MEVLGEVVRYAEIGSWWVEAWERETYLWASVAARYSSAGEDGQVTQAIWHLYIVE